MFLKTKVKPKKLSKSLSVRGNKSSESKLGKPFYFSLANDNLDFYPLKDKQQSLVVNFLKTGIMDILTLK